MPHTKKPSEKSQHLKLVSPNTSDKPMAANDPEARLDEAEALARELAGYDDKEEVTANVTVNFGRESVHDGDPELPGATSVPQKWRPLVALGVGIGTALLAGLATLVQRCGH